MRCLACQRALSDFEATRRYAESKEFLDLCDTCYESVRGSFEVTERPDLKKFEELGDQLYGSEDE
jgi:hypothetical protein